MRCPGPSGHDVNVVVARRPTEEVEDGGGAGGEGGESAEEERRRREDKKKLVVYFGGDVQDVPEAMREAGAEQWLKHNVCRVVSKLAAKHGAACVGVLPDQMAEGTFAVFGAFVQSLDAIGCPNYYTSAGRAVRELDGVLHKVAGELSLREMGVGVEHAADEDTDLVLVGFSKGCVVVNQMLTEVSNADHPEAEWVRRWFLVRVREVHLVDGGATRVTAEPGPSYPSGLTGGGLGRRWLLGPLRAGEDAQGDFPALPADDPGLVDVAGPKTRHLRVHLSPYQFERKPEVNRFLDGIARAGFDICKVESSRREDAPLPPECKVSICSSYYAGREPSFSDHLRLSTKYLPIAPP